MDKREILTTAVNIIRVFTRRNKNYGWLYEIIRAGIDTSYTLCD